MASVMDYLLETLPIAAVANRMTKHHVTQDPRLAMIQSNARELRSALTYMPPGETRKWFPHTAKTARKIYGGVKDQSQREFLPLIWHLDAGQAVDSVATGAVRVREMGLAAHVVFNSVKWGLLHDGTMKPFVVARTYDDIAYALPLTEEYLYCQFWTRGLELPAGHTVHPQGSPLDVGIIRCFLFELMNDGKTEPLRAENLSAEEQGELKRTKKAWEALLEGSTIDDPLTGAGLFAHQVFAQRAPEHISGVIGDDDRRFRSTGQRILVTIAFSVSRDTFDNEPSGALAAARIRPEVYFASTIDLHGAEVSVRLERPMKTTKLESLGKDGPCHCSEMHDEIDNLLVADTNAIDKLCSDVPISPETPFEPNWNPMPQWGNLFSYYSVGGSKEFPGRTFQMVRRDEDAKKSRMAVGLITRRPPETVMDLGKGSPSNKLTKAAFQGEFDNIHMAPRMFLTATHGRRWSIRKKALTAIFSDKLSPETPWVPLDARARLDAIAMAPLCAHDCLHLHWRWGDGFASKHTFGWDEKGSYRKAGAPMIPTNHSLRAKFENRHVITFSERSRELKAGRQEVFFHFQFFYGLAADGLKNNLAPSPQFGTNLSATSEFGNAREDGTIESVPLNSWSSMYWNYRYRFEGDAGRGLIAEEYHTAHDLLAAMKL